MTRPMSGSSPLVPMRWAGHSHVCRETSAGGRGLAGWARWFREQGLDYFGFGHPWEPWDLEILREWELDPDKSRLYREEEIWKRTDPSAWCRPQRFAAWEREFSRDGFLFGVDLETPKIRYGHLWWLGWRPEANAPWHDTDKPWTAWETSPLRDTGAPPPPFRRRYPAEVVRAQADAVPVYAHPTSWWEGAGGCHVTNIACTLVPDVLTGQACGAMVVMGYEANHASYQRLWFDLLDRGYFLTGVAETDACLDFPEPFPKALFQNVARVAERSASALREAVRAGRNLMTTGPSLHIECGGAGPGGFVPANGGEFLCSAAGLVTGDTYRIELLHNAAAAWSRDICGTDSFSCAVPVHGAGWVVARLVNLSRPHAAALTNPVFLGREPVRVTAQSIPPVLCPYWEKPGAQDLLLYLARGDWRRDFPGRAAGDVPPEAFQWERWRDLLS